jgi:hypothetical protein
MSSGSVSTSRPSPPGKSVGEDLLELARTSAKASVKTSLDPLVDLLDDGEQVAPGAP